MLCVRVQLHVVHEEPSTSRSEMRHLECIGTSVNATVRKRHQQSTFITPQLPVASHAFLDYGTILINCIASLMEVNGDPISMISPLHCLLVFTKSDF